jgi:hypothetical protein
MHLKSIIIDKFNYITLVILSHGSLLLLHLLLHFIVCDLQLYVLLSCFVHSCLYICLYLRFVLSVGSCMSSMTETQTLLCIVCDS